jgi:curved DNA-binding protein
MQASTAERRRHPRRKAFLSQEPLIASVNLNGLLQELSVRVVDASNEGLGVQARAPLPIGTTVTLSGSLLVGISQRKLLARPATVVRCTKASDTSYAIGLLFVDGSATPPSAPPPTEEVTDYYDVLQLSPKADADTIHRVYRLLAQRYHPDNVETGDVSQFKLVLEAYRILSDPEKRAAHDATAMRTRQLRWKIFDQAASAQGTEGEKRKRAGILSVLYTQRLNQPREPGMTVHEMEDLLGCPREHLEFGLWYLKEAGCLTRMDNGRYAITVKGADQVEADDHGPIAAHHRLPAPAGKV